MTEADHVQTASETPRLGEWVVQLSRRQIGFYGRSNSSRNQHGAIVQQGGSIPLTGSSHTARTVPGFADGVVQLGTRDDVARLVVAPCDQHGVIG